MERRRGSRYSAPSPSPAVQVSPKPQNASTVPPPQPVADPDDDGPAIDPTTRTIDGPTQAIVGRQDWGANRTVGGPMSIGKTGYTQFKGVHMVDRAGHWAHEEQPEQVSELLTRFLRENG
jgi:pimeloyl-ACP methyl ester carboxylesterase